MITADSIQRSLGGAWRMLMHDADGLQSLDLSFSGFWQSFWAIGLAVPIAIALLLVEPLTLRAAEIDVNGPPGALFYGIEMLSFLVGWLSFPLVMVYLARFLKLSGRYVPLIVAYNWSALLMALLIAPAHMLFAAGIVSLPVLVMINLVLGLVSLYYRWFVVRTAIGGQGMTALGLVMIDIMVSLLIAVGADRLHGWPDFAAGA